jgi:hypothetical protein
MPTKNDSGGPMSGPARRAGLSGRRVIAVGGKTLMASVTAAMPGAAGPLPSTRTAPVATIGQPMR